MEEKGGLHDEFQYDGEKEVFECEEEADYDKLRKLFRKSLTRDADGRLILPDNVKQMKKQALKRLLHGKKGKSPEDVLFEETLAHLDAQLEELWPIYQASCEKLRKEWPRMLKALDSQMKELNALTALMMLKSKL